MFKKKPFSNFFKKSKDLFLPAFEGIEGGFAIGASIMAGLSFAGLSHSVLVTTALISIMVNGFNSASVRYSSTHYVDELDGRETRNPFRDYVLPSVVQFVTYIIIGIISLIPMFLMGDVDGAILYSCLATLFVLFWAGYWRAKLLDMPKIRDGLELMMLGVGIIVVGFVSGWVIHTLIR